jgi:hypothetical protein
MLDERVALLVLHVVRLLIRHGADRLEALLHVALAGEAVEREVRRVALDAGARLRLLRHAARLLLVEERERVAAAIAVVDREGVAGEDALEPRVALELLLGEAAVARAEAASAERRRRRQRRPFIGLVLARPVAAPHRRVERRLRHLGDAHERLPRLGLALEDVREEGEQHDRQAGGGRDAEREHDPGATRARRRVLVHGGFPFSGGRMRGDRVSRPNGPRARGSGGSRAPPRSRSR